MDHIELFGWLSIVSADKLSRLVVRVLLSIDAVPAQQKVLVVHFWKRNLRLVLQVVLQRVIVIFLSFAIPTERDEDESPHQVNHIFGPISLEQLLQHVVTFHRLLMLVCHLQTSRLNQTDHFIAQLGFCQKAALGVFLGKSDVPESLVEVLQIEVAEGKPA